MSNHYFSTYKSPNIVIVPTISFCGGPPVNKHKEDEDPGVAVKEMAANQTVLREHVTKLSGTVGENIGTSLSVMEINKASRAGTTRATNYMQSIGETQIVTKTKSNVESYTSYKESFHTSIEPKSNAYNKTSIGTKLQSQNTKKMFVIPKMKNNLGNGVHTVITNCDRSAQFPADNMDLNKDATEAINNLNKNIVVMESIPSLESNSTGQLEVKSKNHIKNDAARITVLPNYKRDNKKQLTKLLNDKKAENKINERKYKKIGTLQQNDKNKVKKCLHTESNLLASNKTCVITDCNNLKMYNNTNKKCIIPKIRNNLVNNYSNCFNKSNKMFTNNLENLSDNIDTNQNTLNKTCSSVINDSLITGKQIRYKDKSHIEDSKKNRQYMPKNNSKEVLGSQNCKYKSKNTSDIVAKNEISELKYKEKLSVKKKYDGGKKCEINLHKTLNRKSRADINNSEIKTKIKNKDKAINKSQRNTIIEDKIKQNSTLVKSSVKYMTKCKEERILKDYKTCRDSKQKSKLKGSTSSLKKPIEDIHETKIKSSKSVIQVAKLHNAKNKSNNNINLRTKYDLKNEIFKSCRKKIYEMRKNRLSMNKFEKLLVTVDNDKYKKGNNNINVSVKVKDFEPESRPDESKKINVVINIYYKSSNDMVKELDETDIERKSEPIKDEFSFLDDINVDEIVDTLNSCDNEFQKTQSNAKDKID